MTVFLKLSFRRNYEAKVAKDLYLVVMNSVSTF